jgi:membrane protease YdiL (CAAX protease family)
VTRFKGRGLVEDLGARIEARDILPGIGLGLVAQLVVIPLLYYLVILRLVDGDLSGPARDLTDRADGPLGVTLLILVAAVGAPLVEELFYRGFLLRGLERRFGPTPALWISSIVFAAIHFQPLQFPALLIFGLLAGWLALRTGRLGPSWAAHVGFNAITVLILLFT